MKRPRCALVFLPVFLFVACGSLVPLARAQQYPAAEGYLGFTLVNNEYGTDRHNSPGVQLSLGYNASRYMRVAADFSTESHSTNILWTNGEKAQANDYQLLLGPEITFRRGTEFTPFVRGVAGAAWRHYAVPSGNWICSAFSCYEDHFDLARESGFASGVGVGLDWHLWPRASIRLMQFDWFRTHLSRDNANYSPARGQLPISKGWQDNYRFSCGVTFRFGAKGYPLNSLARRQAASP